MVPYTTLRQFRQTFSIFQKNLNLPGLCMYLASHVVLLFAVTFFFSPAHFLFPWIDIGFIICSQCEEVRRKCTCYSKQLMSKIPRKYSIRCLYYSFKYNKVFHIFFLLVDRKTYLVKSDRSQFEISAKMSKSTMQNCDLFANFFFT